MSRSTLACVIALLSAILLPVGTATAQIDTNEPPAQISEVDKLTGDLSNVQKLSRALDVCRRILKKSPDQLDVQARACRICWQIGVQLEDEDKAKDTFTIGYKLAEKMKQRHPDKPDGWYWYAVNYGAFIERSSIFAKITGAGEIMDHAKKTLELDPRYDSGGAYLMVGRINQKIPGGSDAVAEDYFLKAIQVGPRRTTGHLYLSELYFDQKKYADALRETQIVLSGPYEPRFSVEHKLDVPHAQELLEEINKKMAKSRKR